MSKDRIMNGRNYRLIWIGTVLFCTLQSFGQTVNQLPAPELVLRNMFDAVYALKNVRFDMYAQERINGELVKSHSLGVMEYAPRKIFLRGFDTLGVLLNEILYTEGANNNNALISPNGFPYINISLDPLGSTMRKNRHFTILEAGGWYLVDMLKLGLKKDVQKEEGRSVMKLEDFEDIFWKIEILNKDYSFQKYRVLEGEDSRSVSRKLGVPEYKIVELNEQLDSFEDIEPGESILVPNFYAQRVELILRKSDNIPIQVRIFDEKGLYSVYEYKVFDTNVPLLPHTFDRENPAYTF